MKNQVIEVLDREHGKKVIEYWKSKGIDAYSYAGCQTWVNKNPCRFYGVINDKFGNYDMDTVVETNTEIITLPEEPFEIPELPDGVPMRVSHIPILKEGDGTERNIFGKKNGYYLTWFTFNTDNNRVTTIAWKYAMTLKDYEELCKPKVKEVTMADVEKQFGCKVKIIK